MAKIMTKRDIRTLDTFSILVAAKKSGLKVYRGDLWINYAEIDDQMNKIEESVVEKAARLFLRIGKEWLSGIKKKEDLTSPPEELASTLSLILADGAKEALQKGSQSAAKELEDMAIEKHSSSGGKNTKLDEWQQKNDDAFSWYELYMRKTSKKATMDLFERMMPMILDHIEKGQTGKKLSEALAADFARYGAVRADIIARTETNKAYNWGRRYRFDSSSVIAGYRYSAILDSRTTPICRGLHGHSWKIDDPDLDAYTPPNHYRCRSVIVPISTFADFEFNPPDSGWMDQIPDKQKAILSKFMDSAWYPKAATVASRIFPKDLPAPAVPPKGSGQSDQVQSPIPVNVTAQLETADKEAHDNFHKAIEGADLGGAADDKRVRAAMKKLAENILDDATYKGMTFSIAKGDQAAGYIQYHYGFGDPIINVDKFYIKKDYFAGDENKWQTVLHEFYHLNYAGLKSDRSLLPNDVHRTIEETFTEISSQYMAKLAGIDVGRSMPSYAEEIISVIPKLKKAVPEFSDCETLDDFGAKMIKYRFHPDHKTAEWKGIHDEIENVSFSKRDYADQYMDYINNHKDDIVDAVYNSYYLDNLKDPKKITEERAKKVIGDLFDKNIKSRSGMMFDDALLWAMKEMGVKTP